MIIIHEFKNHAPEVTQRLLDHKNVTYCMQLPWVKFLFLFFNTKVNNALNASRGFQRAAWLASR